MFEKSGHVYIEGKLFATINLPSMFFVTLGTKSAKDINDMGYVASIRR